MVNDENRTTKAEWMPCPKIETNYPGLTYIYSLNKIIITNKPDDLHKIIGINGDCYTIYNNQQQKVFLAVQEKLKRKHKITIFNYYGNEVIQIKRPDGICLNRVLVFAPPGNFVGSVEKMLSWFHCFNVTNPSVFLVKNHTGEVVLKVKARRCSLYEYDILSDDVTVGVVTKELKNQSVLMEKCVGASFPLEMDFGHKAVLIGACFLIGF
ncbi:phospholipid scramblase 2-like [Battus philenor]|uniref:phospholipid scramblase 2-like n=1 Tax=Battus philenor TaxID=42288 RepID=UPI0035CE8A4D